MFGKRKSIQNILTNFCVVRDVVQFVCSELNAQKHTLNLHQILFSEFYCHWNEVVVKCTRQTCFESNNHKKHMRYAKGYIPYAHLLRRSSIAPVLSTSGNCLRITIRQNISNRQFCLPQKHDENVLFGTLGYFFRLFFSLSLGRVERCLLRVCKQSF